MKNDVQNIRKSQFVLSYGPGSIIEGKNGSRLIPNLDSGLSRYLSEEFLEKNEIDDIRMSNIVKTLESEGQKHDIGLFSLPSNASLKLKDSVGIYNTFVFPIWKICFDKKHKYPILFDSSKSEKCPICNEETDAHVRFICACPDGHLDEVYWNKAVHNNWETDCTSDYFYWKVNGSSMSSIIVECPICGAKVSMRDIYRMSFDCTGRNPEREKSDFSKKSNVRYSFPDRNFNRCKEKMKVLQKQSTSLRISNTVSLLRIPKYENPIFSLFNSPKLNAIIKMYFSFTPKEDDFLQAIEENAPGVLSEENIKTIKDYIDDVGFEDFQDVFNKFDTNQLTFEDAIMEEFHTLNGDSYCKELLCKGNPVDYVFNNSNGDFPLKIIPIEKLKTVTTQIGFVRKPRIKTGGDFGEIELNKLNYSGFKITPNGKTWYPAYESVGEGIFLTSDYNPISYLGLNNVADKWVENKPIYKDLSGRSNVKNPIFVWWHSFAHALIKTLSLFSGYSSTSLRERIYVKGDIGGILIYNTSPGDDCGMGGLVDLVNDFNPILEYANNILLNCSNDPICSYSEIMSNKVNGAACHNCLLISETSCEHSNMWLDRHFFLGD